MADGGHRLLEIHPADHALSSPLLRKVGPEIAIRKTTVMTRRMTGMLRRMRLAMYCCTRSPLSGVREAASLGRRPGATRVPALTVKAIPVLTRLAGGGIQPAIPRRTWLATQLWRGTQETRYHAAFRKAASQGDEPLFCPLVVNSASGPSQS